MKKLLVIMAIAGTLLTACGEPVVKQPGKLAELAKCLTSKGVIMYGAYWCSHCKTQKEAFGDDFQFVKYQECAKNEQEQATCRAAGVTSYPTWFFPGQGNLVGEQNLSDLAQRANCSDKLPAETTPTPVK